jgi:DNA replicative helicase MCM subunit Mcm2 (Cdc46/Mcm family)
MLQGDPEPSIDTQQAIRCLEAGLQHIYVHGVVTSTSGVGSRFEARGYSCHDCGTCIYLHEGEQPDCCECGGRGWTEQLKSRCESSTCQPQWSSSLCFQQGSMAD